MAKTTTHADYTATALTLTTAAQPNITTLGTLTTLTVDDITIDGSTISDAGDLTLDVAGGINLDSDGGEISFKDAGTEIGKFNNSSSDFAIEAGVQDKDIIFKGNDGGSGITALTLDMSNAGRATFNENVIVGGNLEVSGADVTITANIIHAGDTNTYFGFNDADTFRIVTGGSEALRVNSSQNVGIGTTSPVRKLQVHTAGSNSSYISINNGNTGATVGDGIVVGVASDSTAYFWNYETADTAFATQNTERLRIRSDGKVSIGSTSGAELFNVYAGSGGTAAVEFAGNGNTLGTTSLFVGQGGGGDAYVYQRANLPLIFATNNTERMRIDEGGDLQLAANSSSAGFHFDVSTQTFATTFGTGGNLTLAVTNSSGTGVGGEIFLGGSTRGDALKNCIIFRNASNSEKMRMAENGSFHIGTGGGEANGSTGGCSFSADNNDRRNFICATTGTGTLELIEFRNPNGTVGTIKTSGSSTSYATSSDYRLKENVNYTWDATTRLKQLKPARFNFKTDADTTVDGFLAHEVSSVVPQAISGEKDGEKMQEIDHSKLVPLLVKTIQELEARIATLETE